MITDKMYTLNTAEVHGIASTLLSDHENRITQSTNIQVIDRGV